MKHLTHIGSRLHTSLTCSYYGAGEMGISDGNDSFPRAFFRALRLNDICMQLVDWSRFDSESVAHSSVRSRRIIRLGTTCSPNSSMSFIHGGVANGSFSEQLLNCFRSIHHPNSLTAPSI
ncbi:hypothetical protein CEXT_444311 [Caerostris extrusa]|uniref:Uncharacterized protein n=1 Tax=Caerostris extrusa TaxID=172846 RepID=A0AAV4XIV1_CAEEX|nr:hypothetical protein CEXT_444311 [Caerostris extrusa]